MPARIFVFVVAVVLTLPACAAIREGRAGEGSEWASERAEIFGVLDRQSAAWNRGDLDGFMRGYWRSPELVFTSGGVVRRGWQTTLDRYRDTYGGDTETMGTLSFTDLEVHRLADDAAWALGRWRLDVAGERLGGIFTLVFRELGGEWKIVHDHTTSAPPR